MDIQESSREGNVKFNSLGIIRENKRSWRVHFQIFKEPKIQNFGNQGATSRVYWVYYKPPVLSYSEVGTYANVEYMSCGEVKAFGILSIIGYEIRNRNVVAERVNNHMVQQSCNFA